MTVALNLLNAIFVMVGGYIAIVYLFPMLRDFLAAGFKDEKVVDALMGIFNLYVIIFVTIGIVRELVLVNNQYLNYVTVLIPALTIMTDLIPYLKYLVAGVIIVVGLGTFKKK